MLGRKFPTNFFFPFPHKILQEIFPTYIFISHTKVSFLTQSFYSQNSLIFSISLTRPHTHTHTHTHTHNLASADKQSPAQPSDDVDEAEPSHWLLSSSISLPSNHTDRLSLPHHKILSPFLPLSPYHPHTHSFFLTIPIAILILLSKLFILFFVLIIVKFWVWIWILNIRLFI